MNLTTTIDADITATVAEEFDLIHLIVDMTATESMAETFLDADQARQLAAELVRLADSIERESAR